MAGGERVVVSRADAGSAAAVIAAYAPRSVSEAAAGFAREAVARAAPGAPGRAKALLFACSRLAGFAERVGLELSPEVLFSEAVIERLVLVGCDGLSPASVRTLRTNLRSLARSLARYPEPVAVALPRERAKRPYAEAEIEGYLRLAGALSTRRRWMRASAMVCLGAGAGIVASELRHVRGSEVSARAGGVIVTVSGRRARSVPVLARYHEPLLAAAAFAGERFIVGGREPGRRNITDELCALLSSDTSLPRLESGRLRSTWLLTCARQIGLGAFMQAAGVFCSQRLGDLAAQIPAVTEAELVARLGAGM
jgi:integrase